MLMKIINILLPLLLSLFVLGCGRVENYSYRKKEFVRPANPKAAVERAWLARNKYDHERRMLIPMVGGTRWGAIQEYKEDGTLEYKEWWVRDIKKEDLEAKPSTAIKMIRVQNNDQSTTLNRIKMEKMLTETPDQSNKSTENRIEPSTDSSAEIDFPLDNSELPNEDSPFAPLPFESAPSLPNENLPESAPFAPLPEGLPPLEPLGEDSDTPQPDPFG